MHYLGDHGSLMLESVTVILAGGYGRRIGGHKAEKQLNGMRLIDVAIKYADQLDTQYALAVRESDQLSISHVNMIIDADVEGPLGGLIAALDWALSLNARTVLTVPCDMPFMPDNLYERLAYHVRNDRPAVAVSGERQHPVCALWPITCRDEVVSYAASGSLSLRGVLQKCSAIEVSWPDKPEDPFLNINTQAELELASSLMKRVQTEKP